MAPGKESSRPKASRRRLWLALAGCVALAGGFLLVYIAFFHNARAPVTDPRLTIATPFLNVHPDVGYIGDAACARCHAAIAEDYRKHSMGRSLSPVAQVAQAAPVEGYTNETRNPFKIGPLRFSVERQGERMLHRQEYVRGDRALTELATEVQYAIGFWQ